MTHFRLHMPLLTSALRNFHLYNPPSGSGLIRGEAIDPDADHNAKLLQSYHASQKTAITGIINKMDARVSRGEGSTPFEEEFPDAPDYFSQEDFRTAYDHENLLQRLEKLPKEDVEKYFQNLNLRDKWDLRENASKTRKFWRQHPGSRVRYFPNAELSIEWYSSSSLLEMFSSCPSHMIEEESPARTELSPVVADRRSSGQETQLDIPVEAGPVGTHLDFMKAGVYYNSYDPDLIIYEPKPQRKHNIAADIEKLVERSTVDEPTSIAEHEAYDATWTQQDDYQYQQYQQNTRQIAAHDCHRQYMGNHHAPHYRNLNQAQAPLWFQQQQTLETLVPELNPWYQRFYLERCVQFSGHTFYEQLYRPPPTPYLRPFRGCYDGDDELREWRL